MIHATPAPRAAHSEIGQTSRPSAVAVNPAGYAPRPQGGARAFDGERSSGFAPRKPYTPREGAAGPSRFGGKPTFSRDRESRDKREGRGAEHSGRPSGPPFRKFDAPRTPRPYSSERPIVPIVPIVPSVQPGTPESPGANPRVASAQRSPTASPAEPCRKIQQLCRQKALREVRCRRHRQTCQHLRQIQGQQKALRQTRSGSQVQT